MSIRPAGAGQGQKTHNSRRKEIPAWSVHLRDTRLCDHISDFVRGVGEESGSEGGLGLGGGICWIDHGRRVGYGS